MTKILRLLVAVLQALRRKYLFYNCLERTKCKPLSKQAPPTMALKIRSHRIFIVTILAVVFSVNCNAGTQHLKKNKRNVYQLGKMIECTTGRSFWYYLSYGCYCGYGGSGISRDETDECCKQHDECYQRLIDTGTCWSWQPYFWTYSHIRAFCDTSYAYISCGSSWWSECSVPLCTCDKELAECVRHAEFDYRNFLHRWFYSC